MNRSLRLSLLIVTALLSGAQGADLQISSASIMPTEQATSAVMGRVSVLSGDTLWFPTSGVRIRIAGIKSCALQQWAFDPIDDHGLHLAPVPCGSLAKAWLTRVIGGAAVSCQAQKSQPAPELSGRCHAGRLDLGYEQLQIGMARLDGVGFDDIRYVAAEQRARLARYGLWGTYVLDPNEWQERATNRISDRPPAADRKLLESRRSEITPPFLHWRHNLLRADR
jgi:endonuclease YncB( thermonuclease family)